MGAQLIYSQVMTSAMRAVTHQTVDFLPGVIYAAMSIWVVFWFARERRGRRAMRAGGPAPSWV